MRQSCQTSQIPANMKRRSRSLSPNNTTSTCEHKLLTASAPPSPKAVKRVKIRRNFFSGTQKNLVGISTVNSAKQHLECKNQHVTTKIKIEPNLSKQNDEHIEVIDISESIDDANSIDENLQQSHAEVGSEVNQNPNSINDVTQVSSEALREAGIGEARQTYDKVIDWLCVQNHTETSNIPLNPGRNVTDPRQIMETSSRTSQNKSDGNYVPHKAPVHCMKHQSSSSTIGTCSHMITQDENSSQLEPSTYGSHGNIRGEFGNVQETSHLKRVSSEPVLGNKLSTYKVIQEVYRRKQPTSIFNRRVHIDSGSTQPQLGSNEAIDASGFWNLSQSSQLKHSKMSSTSTPRPVVVNSDPGTHKLCDNYSAHLDAVKTYMQQSSDEIDARYLDLIQKSAVDDALKDLGALYDPTLAPHGVHIQNKAYDLHFVRVMPDGKISIPRGGNVTSNDLLPTSAQKQSGRPMQQSFPRPSVNPVYIRPLAGHALAQFKHGQLTFSPFIPEIPTYHQRALRTPNPQQFKICSGNGSVVKPSWCTPANHLYPNVLPQRIQHGSPTVSTQLIHDHLKTPTNPQMQLPKDMSVLSTANIVYLHHSAAETPRRSVTVTPKEINPVQHILDLAKCNTVTQRLGVPSSATINPNIAPRAAIPIRTNSGEEDVITVSEDHASYNNRPAESPLHQDTPSKHLNITGTDPRLHVQRFRSRLATGNRELEVIHKQNWLDPQGEALHTPINDGENDDSEADTREQYGLDDSASVENNLINWYDAVDAVYYVGELCTFTDHVDQHSQVIYELLNDTNHKVNKTKIEMTTPRMEKSGRSKPKRKVTIPDEERSSTLQYTYVVARETKAILRQESFKLKTSFDDSKSKEVIRNKLCQVFGEDSVTHDGLEVCWLIDDMAHNVTAEENQPTPQDGHHNDKAGEFEVELTDITIISDKTEDEKSGKPLKSRECQNQGKQKTKTPVIKSHVVTRSLARKQSLRRKNLKWDEWGWIHTSPTALNKTKHKAIESANRTVSPQQENEHTRYKYKRLTGKRKCSMNAGVSTTRFTSVSYLEPTTKKVLYVDQEETYKELGFHKSTIGEHKIPRKETDAPEVDNNNHVTRSGTVYKFKRERDIELYDIPECIVLSSDTSDDENSESITLDTYNMDEPPSPKVDSNNKDEPPPPKVDSNNKDEPPPPKVDSNNKDEPPPPKVDINNKDEPPPPKVDSNDKAVPPPPKVDANNKAELPPPKVSLRLRRSKRLSGGSVSDTDKVTDHKGEKHKGSRGKNKEKVENEFESNISEKTRDDDVMDEINCEPKSTCVPFDSDGHLNDKNKGNINDQDIENVTSDDDITMEEKSAENVEKGVNLDLKQNECDREENAIKTDTQAVIDSMLNHMEFLTQVKRGLSTLKLPKGESLTKQSRKTIDDFIDDSELIPAAIKNKNKRVKRNSLKRCFCMKSPKMSKRLRLGSVKVPDERTVNETPKSRTNKKPLSKEANGNQNLKVKKCNDPRKARPGLVRFKTITKEEFQNEKIRIHQCEFCRRFSSEVRRDVREHILREHKFRCYRCKIVFPSEVKKQKHMEVHIKEKHYCLQCQQEFCTKAGYRRHISGRLHVIVERAQHMAIDVVYKACTGNTIEARQIASRHKLDINTLVGGHSAIAESASCSTVNNTNNEQTGTTSDQETAPTPSVIKHHYHNNPMLETLLTQLENFEKSDIIQFFKSRGSEIFEQSMKKNDAANKGDKELDDTSKGDKKDDKTYNDDQNGVNTNKDDTNDATKDDKQGASEEPTNSDTNDEQLDTSDLLYQLCQEIGIFDSNEDLDSMVDDRLLNTDIEESADQAQCESLEEGPHTCTTEKDGTNINKQLDPFPNVTIEQCKDISASSNCVNEIVTNTAGQCLPIDRNSIPEMADCTESNNPTEINSEQTLSVAPVRKDVIPDGDLNNNEIDSPGETENNDNEKARCNSENGANLSNIQSNANGSNQNVSVCTLTTSGEPRSLGTVSSQLPHGHEDMNHGRDTTYSEQATYDIHGDFFASFLQDIASIPDDLLYHDNGSIDSGEINSELKQLNDLTSEDLGESFKDLPQGNKEVIIQDTNETFADISDSTISNSTPQAILDAVNLLNNC